MIYARKLEDYLLGFYYLVLWNDYSKEKNIWKLTLAIQHLQKLITIFHKKHLEKLTTTSTSINTAPPMARPTVRPKTSTTKQKCGWLTKTAATNKRTKKR